MQDPKEEYYEVPVSARIAVLEAELSQTRMALAAAQHQVPLIASCTACRIAVAPTDVSSSRMSRVHE